MALFEHIARAMGLVGKDSLRVACDSLVIRRNERISWWNGSNGSAAAPPSGAVR